MEVINIPGGSHPQTTPGKQRVWSFLGLSLTALGVIYGDIGTSPLYAYSSIFTDSNGIFNEPSRDDAVGALSVLLWLILLVVCVKYVIFILQADNHGEGGTFALAGRLMDNSLLNGYEGKYTKLAPQAAATTTTAAAAAAATTAKPGVPSVRTIAAAPAAPAAFGTGTNGSTSGSGPGSAEATQHVYQNGVMTVDDNNFNGGTGGRTGRWALFAAMTGAALLIGDGMLTPAISVVSALEGIQTYAPSISRDVIVVLSIIILFILYMVQRFGTHRIGSAFGPIMIVWFIALTMLGINNIATYDATVFRAFNPAEAVNYFHRNGFEGWASIGSAMLAVTGVETMYADLGHFGVKSVRFAWFALPLPALLLNYIGQAAFVMHSPSDAGSSFYASMPSQVLWPMIVLSTMATIIASQAVITGSFSLMRQAINLGVCPRLSIYFTNKAVSGQIYVPSINYALMIGTICLVAGFQTSASMTAAYGLAISMIFIITTVLFTVNAIKVFKWRPYVWIPLALFMLALDVNMVGANLLKVPKGGWFPLCIAAVVTAIFAVWKLGKEQLVAKTKASEQTVEQLKATLEVDGNLLRPHIKTIFLCNTDDINSVPHVLTAYVTRSMTLPEPSIFCNVKVDSINAFYPPEKRFEYICVDGTADLHRLTVNFGFAERTNGFHTMVLDHLEQLGFKGPDTLFIAGQNHIVPKDGCSIWHQILISAYSTLQFFNVPLFQNLGITPESNLTVVTTMDI